MQERQTDARPVLRRPKGRPCEDFWHTMRVGLPLALALFLALPVLFRWLDL